MDSTVDREEDIDRYDPSYRQWIAEAVRKIRAEANRSSDTNLISVPLPAEWGIDLYLKDESTHPTGSLKHRLARSLFLYALCNGWIKPGRPVIEASSGSTAISEAYFSRLIGVPFIAVVARSTSVQKVKLIESHGGQCHLVENPGEVYDVAAAVAERTGGHYMDQFTYAERATDWRGTNNIAESIFRQMAQERHPEPAWIVATAGTGGTSATLARYIRYAGKSTGICIADPENSAFFPSWKDQDPTVTTAIGSRIEGIGRQRVEGSFIGSAIDRMMLVPDAAAVASIRHLSELLGRRTGASTGTGLWSAFRIISEMVTAGKHGSVVSLICDAGDRYLDKYYSDDWLAKNNLHVEPYYHRLESFMRTGTLS
ncbi:PLP-dependent cysteine synthase family protein [Paenarthrobacter aurescens]|jgi:cysteine synthase A|uniref:L-cysteine desulfhydrase Cds1 n=1 Tax=Paenarthrobacter aurescens (strain TC1) TaxID=290340 RepID=A1RDM0_PAEAT|nr:PLP-dependent cysteine synthase family protein [Paenarthrobacter aurescens]ABM10796.1 Pyridoxal-phosphate dependent enzyme [Paenarthrobacter aurescens TC1]